MNYLAIGTILRRASKELSLFGIETHDLDARVLLEAALGKDRPYIFAHPEMPMTNTDYAKFRRYIRRRKKGEPIAYILGHKEFYGLDFIVNKNVLVPRPETELLVESGISYIVYRNNLARAAKYEIPNTKYEIRVLDIGTGSGCIIIPIAEKLKKYEIPNTKYEIRYYATDISQKALTVAKKNATKYDAKELIRFYRSDLFSNPRLPKRFDLIIANLPYVPKEQKAESGKRKGSLDFEPQEAIFADKNGTAIIKPFLSKAKDRINNNGLILAELDPRNAKELQKCAQKNFPIAQIELKQDLAGLNRYLVIQT